MSKHTPEIVEDGVLFTDRLKVPGGWIYRSYDKSSQVMGCVFVPIASNTALDLYRELEALVNYASSCGLETADAERALAKAEGRDND